jgi:hypothetical protein
MAKSPSQSTICSIPTREKSVRCKSAIFYLDPFIEIYTMSSDYDLDIQVHGSRTPLKNGKLTVSLKLKPEQPLPPNTGPPNAPSSSKGNTNLALPSIVVSSTPEPTLPYQDPKILSEVVQSAGNGVASLHTSSRGAKVAVTIDDATAISSNDSFNTALDVLGGLIEIGDVLAEVSNILSTSDYPMILNPRFSFIHSRSSLGVP